MKKAISKQELEGLQRQNPSVKLIDIRPAAEYEKMHIPGSINIPADTISEAISGISKSDTIVCICTKGLERSQDAAESISSMGFDNVYYLKEGVTGWLHP